MRDAGLLDGDRVIIDRAVEPHDGSIVVAWWGGEGFTMKYLDLTHKNDGYTEGEQSEFWDDMSNLQKARIVR